MKKAKKLEPQSWESAYGWLSTLVADPKKDEKPVLQCIKVQDGRAYATDSYILGSTGCPEVCPSGTLLSAKGAGENAPVLSTSPTAYSDVQRLLERTWGQNLVVVTEDLIDALKRVVVLQKDTANIDKLTLILFNRQMGVVYIYAEDQHGAALSEILTGSGNAYDQLSYLSGCWFDAAKWLKVLKGWVKGKHGWPNADGSYQTLIEFARPNYLHHWYAPLATLSPFTEDTANAPFALVMSCQTGRGFKLASDAWEKARSASTDTAYRAKLKGYKPVRPFWKQAYSDVSDLPMFQDIPPFELGKTDPLVLLEKSVEVLSQGRRAAHFVAMRNHPAMLPYNHAEAVAQGEQIEPFIEAIKASQRP